MEKYKELFNKFYLDKGIDKKYAEKYLSVKVFYEYDLYNYQHVEDIIQIFFEVVGKKEYIKNFRSTYVFINKFYDWSTENGYIVFNPFERFPNLNYKNLINEYVQRSNVTVFYEEDIDNICNNIIPAKSKNITQRLFQEALILLSYNGIIFSSADFAKLTIEDIDFVKLTIKNKKMRSDLVNTLLLYVNNYEKGKFQRYNNHLIALPSKTFYKIENEDMYIEKTINYINNSLKKLSLMVGNKMSVDAVAKSGFLKYVHENVGDKFNDVFEIDDNLDLTKINKEPTENVILLERLMEEFGEKGRHAYEIKQKYFVAARKSKWWNWNN